MLRTIRRAPARRSDGEGGFTLIELLVVVLILGVLSGITILGVSDARANSIISACNADKVEIVKALDAYKADPTHDTYPAALSDLAPKFLHQAPNVDATKGEYYFTYTPASGSTLVTAHASNGKSTITTTNCPAL